MEQEHAAQLPPGPSRPRPGKRCVPVDAIPQRCQVLLVGLSVEASLNVLPGGFALYPCLEIVRLGPSVFLPVGRARFAVRKGTRKGEGVRTTVAAESVHEMSAPAAISLEERVLVAISPLNAVEGRRSTWKAHRRVAPSEGSQSQLQLYCTTSETAPFFCDAIYSRRRSFHISVQMLDAQAGVTQEEGEGHTCLKTD